MSTLVTVFLWSVVLYPGGKSFGQSPVLSNENVILASLCEKLEQWLIQKEFKKPFKIEFEAPATVYASLAEHLIQAGFQLKDESKGHRLKVVVKSTNSFLSGRKSSIRTLNAEFGFTMIDADSSLVGTIGYVVEHQDELEASVQPADLEGYWEASKFSENRVEASRWKHLLQKVAYPGLIISAIGTTIYLLFTVRG